MANFAKECDVALYGVLSESQALAELAPGGVWSMVAPQNTPAPWVVFQMMSKLDEHTFGARFANAIYMVKAVTESLHPKEAQSIDTVIDTLLEDANLTISGFGTSILCRRESDIPPNSVEAPGRTLTQIGGLYRIMADQA